MKKICIAVCMLLSFTAFAAAQDKTLTDAEKAAGWVSIFDGKTLEGWKSNEKTEGFEVKDGCIVGKGDRNHLFYMEELQDFELKIDCKINKGGNSGLYVKSQWVEGNWPVEGFELQINSSHSDPVKTGSLYNIVKLFKAPHEDDQWFTYYVTVRGNTLTVRVNDTVLYDYVDPVDRGFAAEKVTAEKISEATKLIRQKGYIALQQHDPGTTPQFKNIFLRKIEGRQGRQR